MRTEQALIPLPEELIAEIDSVVGPDGGNAFVAETAQAELRRRRLLGILRNPEPAWKEEDHPELANGSQAWVRTLRDGWHDGSGDSPSDASAK